MEPLGQALKHSRITMKKKHKSLLLALAVPAILASCAREREMEKPEENPQEPVEVSVGHPVTISAGLPPETRISHVYENGQIKPCWEEEDAVLVSFTLNEETIVETFTLKTGAGTQSATFSNDNSQLGTDTPFTVDYVDYNHPEGWAVQDGTLAHLPECLSGKAADITASVTLEPALTYFHVIASIPEGKSFTHAYLNKLEGGFTMNAKPGTKGAVTVEPENAFSGNVDFYIAVKLVDDTTSEGVNVFGETVPPTFQVIFGNGIQGVSLDGQAFSVAGESYKYNWSPAKTYVAGKVYKIQDKTFTAAVASQALPR